MKILQINVSCGRGSTGRIATDIHKLLLEQGHESVIAYGRGEAINCDKEKKNMVNLVLKEQINIIIKMINFRNILSYTCNSFLY